VKIRVALVFAIDWTLNLRSAQILLLPSSVNYRKLFGDLIPSPDLWRDMRCRDDGSCISGGVSRRLNLKIGSLLEKENKLSAYGL